MYDHIYGSKGQHIGYRQDGGLFDHKNRRVADVDVNGRITQPLTDKLIGYLQPIDTALKSDDSLDRLFAA